MMASSPCRPSRIEASVVVLVGVGLGGCRLAVRVGVVVVVAAVGGSLGSTSLTTAPALQLVVLAVMGCSVLMAVYPVGGSPRLIPKNIEQIIMIG
jgi:hypothetical protein